MRSGARARVLIGLVALLVAAACVAPLVLDARRRAAANRRYDGAVAAYMSFDVARSAALFAEVARDYPDLSIGPMAELKIAFLHYDDGDLDTAEALFAGFLRDHPETIVHLPETPRSEYHGELQLVARFFLGRIAEDRGDESAARLAYQGVVERGSRNPGNIIVAEARSIIRRRDREPPR